jgi:3'5'-cyclic nucleotide phosphodiesterase
MESNSQPGRILCSQKTADNLTNQGKQHWIKERSGLVNAKGKGLMKTYWVTPSRAVAHDISTDSSNSDERRSDYENKKKDAVDWMTNVLVSALEDVALQRVAKQNLDKELHTTFVSFACPRDEVSEIIVLPKPSENPPKIDGNVSRLNDAVKQQTFEYVSCLADMYRDNPFHNFHHASHVVMSAQKLLGRIVRPAEGCVSETAYGIASDALSQFAIIFSALIHDVDHPGVSNAQLVKERLPVAIKYDNKSVAEQNSITLAWELLNEDRFTDFRNQIMQTEAECTLFRKLIVNSVMATDLFDADLKKLRENRWARVFDTNDLVQEDEDCNRRATIVIEHIIQASDVCHTMQHWHVYQEWNRRLFEEMYSGYLAGRVEKDPSEGWYQGELWFFDNYIIPLAKKLETCGVFGVSCGELLDYARDNRSEWAEKGCDIVKEHLIRMKTQKVSDDDTRNSSMSWTDKVDETITFLVAGRGYEDIVSEHSI